MIWIVLAYIVFTPITYSAFFAYLQRQWPYIAEENYRKDLTLSVLLALIPSAWIVIPYTTNFFQHGFKFK